jgi:hypothetical protein
MSIGSYKEEETFEKASSAFNGRSEQEGERGNCKMRTTTGDLAGERTRGRLMTNESSNSEGRRAGRQEESHPTSRYSRSTGCLLEHQLSDLKESMSTGSLCARTSKGQKKKRNVKIVSSIAKEDTVSVCSEEVSETSEEEMKGNEEWKAHESSGSDSVNEELIIDEAGSTLKQVPSSSIALKTHCEQSGGTGMTIPRKRRRIGDENEVRRPLDLGWSRQVRLKQQPNGVCKSEVFYVTPCGKKIRTYPDVGRYLHQIGSTGLTLSDFSFSAKIFLGEFYEFNGAEYEKLSMDELERRRQASVDARKEREAKLTSKRKKQANNNNGEENEQHANSKHESKLGNSWGKEQMSQKVVKDEDKYIMGNNLKAKEDMAMSKVKEDPAREAKEMELKKQQIQEKERQAEVAAIKAHERELRRQQAMAIKAEEAHRKALIREKLRVERETEKQRQKQLKAKKKRLTPVTINGNDSTQVCDDVLVQHQNSLPVITPIDHEVSAVSFSDVLLVVEFVNTFHEVFDLQEFPTIGSLQAALINRHPYRDSLVEFCIRVLDIMIHDSGCGIHHIVVPMGTLLSSVDLTNKTFSEVLRIVLEAKGYTGPSRALSLLSRHSFLSLAAGHKSAILAFLVNELLTSRVVLRIMDCRQERMTDLRRCKWKIQCKIRKVRQAISEHYPTEASPDGKHPTRKPRVTLINDGEEDEEEDEEEGSDDGVDVGDDSDGLSDVDMNDVEETTLPKLKHDLEGELNKLQKWHHLYRRKLHAAMHSMRSMSFGVDRYSRRYWALSHCGGIFVEGIDCEEKEHGLWWKQSQSIRANEAELLKDTKVESIPPLIKLPMQLQANSSDKPGEDNYHTLRNHRLQQVRCGRYQRSTTLPSKEGTLQTQTSEDGSEHEGSIELERKRFSPYGRISSYNPFQCDVMRLQCEMQKNNSVVKPVAVQPSLSPGAWRGIICTKTESNGPETGTGSHELSLLAAVATSQRECEQWTQEPKETSAMKSAEKAETQNYKAQSIVCKLASALSSEGYNWDTANEQQRPVSVKKDLYHGWWVIKEADEIRSVFKALSSQGFRENGLKKTLCRNLEYAYHSCGKGIKDVMIPKDNSHSWDDSPETVIIDDTFGAEDGVDYPQQSLSASLVLLNDIEDLEERLLSASLQSKGWKPRSVDGDELESAVDNQQTSSECLRSASDRLLALEKAIERRYLKPPLRDKYELSHIISTVTLLSFCLL